MGFQLSIDGVSFHMNHPIFCPRILMSNQANEKLRSANNELGKSGCPCQSERFMRLLSQDTRYEFTRKCNNGKCAFKQYGDVLKNLANNYQSELKRNGINISEKERSRCMLSSNQPSKIIEEYLFTHFTIQLEDQQVTTISDS